MEAVISQNAVQAFALHLREEERCPGTVEKYLRDVRAFALWLEDRALSKEQAAAWKRHLLSAQYAPATVNSMLTALNRFFVFLGRRDCRVKLLRIQRRLFRDKSRELSREEYRQLLEAGGERTSLVMEAICSTGIRVSETAFITVQAAADGEAVIQLKGKIRRILLPGKLCRKLLRYARKRNISSGPIFLTRNGTPLSRRQIWGEMKALCAKAGVAPSKVFPHNLRHRATRSAAEKARH